MVGVPETYNYGIVWVVLGLVCAIALLFIVMKMRRKRGAVERARLSANVAERDSSPGQKSVEARLRRCPKCRTTYTDETLNYCLIDGAALVDAAEAAKPYDPQATMKINREGSPGIAPTIEYRPDLTDGKN